MPRRIFSSVSSSRCAPSSATNSFSLFFFLKSPRSRLTVTRQGSILTSPRDHCPLSDSLVTQRHHGIHAHGAARGQCRSKESRGRKQESAGYVRQRIGGTHSKEQCRKE